MRALINTAQIRQIQSERNSPSREFSRMLNGGQEKQQELQQKKLEDEKIKRDFIKKKKIDKMALNNQERREAWINSVQYDSELIEKFQNGNIPLSHPNKHKFRDFNSTGFTYRSNSQSFGNSVIQYQNQDFSDKQPHIVNNFRDRKNFKEISGFQFKYQPQSSEQRVAQSIQQTPPLSTEPLNTLLISMPKWREYNKSKWNDIKNFNAQKTSRDKTWDPLSNTSPKFNEPYIDKVTEFRPDYSKKQNTPIIPTNQSFIDNKKYSNIQKVFDATVAQDHTWKQRLLQSSSLRQRAHLNLSIKLKEQNQDYNYPLHNYDYPIISSNSQTKEPQQIETSETIQNSETPDTKVKKFFQFQQITKLSPPKVDNVDSQQDQDDKFKQNQLSQILSESYNTPKHFVNKNSKSPIKAKEKVIDLNTLKTDSAAKLLNNTFNKSFTNSWQYKIIQPQQNKNFETKVDLNDSHILHELDKVKTYYGSLVGKRTSSSQMSSPINNERGNRYQDSTRKQNQILYTPIKQDNSVRKKDQIGKGKSPNSSIELNLDSIKMKRRQIRSTVTSPISQTPMNKDTTPQYGGRFGYRDFNTTAQTFNSMIINKDKNHVVSGQNSIKEAINKYFNKLEKVNSSQCQ